MKRFALILAALLTPGAALAQAGEPPSLWNCLGETRVECRGTDCTPADVVGSVQVSFVGWFYERCVDICIGGRSTTWVETSLGEVVAIADDYPQHLILRPENRFADIAYVSGVSVITEGRCFPALKDQATALSLLDVFDAYKAAPKP